MRSTPALAVLVFLVACDAADSPPALDLGSDSQPADLQPDIRAPRDGGGDADGAPPDSAIADSAPADAGWPAGFTPTPKHVPSGMLCTIPADYVKNGGDPVNPPCKLEADRFSTHDHSWMPSGLKVVTWNVEYGKQSSAVVKQLSTNTTLLDADVLLLQEVPRKDKQSVPQGINLARTVAKTLKLNYVFGVEWDRRLDAKQAGEHGLAILSKYPIGNAKLLRHPALYNFYWEKKDFGGRATLAAEIVVAGKRLQIYNSHLCTRDWTGSGRAKQAAEVLADASLAGTPTVKLLGGDLNTFLCNPKIANCNKAPAAEKVIEQINKDGWTNLTGTFNGWTQMGAGFFPQRLDWLFGKGVTPVSHAALQKVSAADHVPLLAVFSVP